MPPPHHWLHPQTVPRGFLRLYVLTLLSDGPRSGYSIIQQIVEKTEGAWRPGPGTMYPLLRGLRIEGLVKAEGSGWRRWNKNYVLTPKGKKELEDVRKQLAGAGKKEAVMGRLFSGLLPASVFVPLMMNRYREGIEFFKQKLSEVPQPERNAYLKELGLFAESQLEWVRSQLEGEKVPSRDAQKTEDLKS